MYALLERYLEEEELLEQSQEAEGLSWLYRLCESKADRAELRARGITPETRVHHVSELPQGATPC
jgi:hypothetical protein